MADTVDPNFSVRADAFIDLANTQLPSAPGPLVAASMSFATARFNAWLCANMYRTPEQMTAMRAEAIALLTDHYNKMLEDSFSDALANFKDYVAPQA
jgi:hypothetical protein